MYRLWSEWDIGEGDKVFESKDAGMRWLLQNKVVAEIATEDGVTVEAFLEQCFEEGYYSWHRLQIID